MDKAIKLTAAQRAKLMQLELLQHRRAARVHRARGRLFVGAAPTAECAAERSKLFREWEKVIEFYEAKHRDNLLRHLRDMYERPDSDKSARQMRFIRDVEELRDFEAKEWERLKEKGGKRAGTWRSASRKRRR
jgi:hypothetical protein